MGIKDTTSINFIKLIPVLPSFQYIPTTGQPTRSKTESFQELSRHSAFRCYSPTSATAISRRGETNGNNKFKQAISFYRNFDSARRTYIITNSQLHHLQSESTRRQSIRESYQALRQLFPQNLNADRLSVLNHTREYLISLQALVAKLSQRNQQLEAQLESSSAKVLQQTQNISGASKLPPARIITADWLMNRKRVPDNDVFLFPYMPDETSVLEKMNLHDKLL